MKKLLTILFILGSLIAKSQCSHNTVILSLTDFNAKEAYYPNGYTLGLHGGDTLKIPVLAAGAKYSLIQLDSISGSQGCPINIVPMGSQVLFTQIRIGQLHKSTYIHIAGIGTSTFYGFKGGVLTIGLADHIEVDHFDNSGLENGLFFHVNPDSAVFLSLYPNYVANKYSIHDNYVHNTSGEGFYIGHTYPFADPYPPSNGRYTPIRMDSVEIFNNIVDSTGWDGIQLSNAQDGCSIHDNTVTHFGTSDVGGQRAGIIFGANSSGSVYNNTVRNGTGNGIQLFGYGYNPAYNNTIDHVGNTLDDGCSGCQGEQSFFTKAANNIEVRAKQVIDIHDNTIVSPRPRGVLQTNNDANYSDTAKFRNNTVCFNTTVPVSWETTYVSISQTIKVVTGNTGIVCSAPLANAGSDQTITLPVSTATLNGSATAGSGHSLTSYLWTTVSGPSSPTINNSSTLTSSPIGLLQGIYIFRLTVTQNDSQTASDDVQVTVNPGGPPATNLRLQWLKTVKIR